MKQANKAEIKRMIVEALELGSPQSFTAGEVTDAVSKALGIKASRSAVKRALDAMVANGEAHVEFRNVWRNGFEVKGARHYYATRPKRTYGCPDDPFEGLVEQAFAEAVKRFR